MICKFCGNVIDDNSDFCFICGQKDPGETTEAQTEAVESNDIFSQPPVEAPAPVAAVATEVPIVPEAPVAPEAPEASFNAEPVYVQPPVFTGEIPTVPTGTDAPVYGDNPAPVYAQAAPIYAQSAPVYAQQVIIQQVAPAQIIKTKSKEPKAAGPVSKAKKIFTIIFAATFILQFIPWIWYNKAKKSGDEEKASVLLNTIYIGLFVFIIAVCFVFIKNFIL